LFNIKNSPIKLIFCFFILLILEILFLSSSLILVFKISISDTINQKNIPDIAKYIYISMLYIFILSNLYFLDKVNFLSIFKIKIKNIQHFFSGFLLGFGFLIFLYTLETILKFIQIKQININPLLILQIFIFSFCIALVEELLFRNFIFRKLNEKYKAIPAFCFSSYIYAQLHFLRFDLNFIEIILPLIGLFFVGILLSYLFVKYSLWFSIGVHTIWIILISFTTQTSIFIVDKKYILFTGGYYPVAGIFGILLLLFMIFIIKNFKINL